MAKAKAKKAASDDSPKPAAKKAAKQASGKAEKSAAEAPAPTPITEADWTQIYAKAWTDAAFRTLLETDPTAALEQYAAEHGKQWSTLVIVPPDCEQVEENCIHLVSCC